MLSTRCQVCGNTRITQGPAQHVSAAGVATALMFGFAARAGMQALRATASNRNAQLMAMRSFAAAAEGGSGVSFRLMELELEQGPSSTALHIQFIQPYICCIVVSCMMKNKDPACAAVTVSVCLVTHDLCLSRWGRASCRAVLKHPVIRALSTLAFDSLIKPLNVQNVPANLPCCAAVAQMCPPVVAPALPLLLPASDGRQAGRAWSAGRWRVGSKRVRLHQLQAGCRQPAPATPGEPVGGGGAWQRTVLLGVQFVCGVYL